MHHLLPSGDWQSYEATFLTNLSNEFRACGWWVGWRGNYQKMKFKTFLCLPVSRQGKFIVLCTWWLWHDVFVPWHVIHQPVRWMSRIHIYIHISSRWVLLSLFFFVAGFLWHTSRQSLHFQFIMIAQLSYLCLQHVFGFIRCIQVGGMYVCMYVSIGIKKSGISICGNGIESGTRMFIRRGCLQIFFLLFRTPSVSISIYCSSSSLRSSMLEQYEQPQGNWLCFCPFQLTWPNRK